MTSDASESEATPPASDSPPLLSICIPTHHGRRALLAELLESVIGQARGLPGQIEICVSDNASADGTDQLLAELGDSAPCQVVYRRHERDGGLARNLFASVELASGRYCWLLGSDDLLADDALRRVCELLGRFPGASGYTVGAVHVDAEDATLRSRALPRRFHPPQEQSCLIDGLDRVYDDCGNAWSTLSWSLVDRDAWLEAASAQREAALAHPIFPQVIVMAAMAATRPRWGWFAEPLVRQRNATTFLFEHSKASTAERWAQIIEGAAAVWAHVLKGRFGRRWRRRMRRLLEVWGSAADVRATVLYERPPPAARLRLARALFWAFWPAREYWRAVGPASAMPIRLIRSRYAVTAADPSAPPARVALTGVLPAVAHTEAVVHLRLTAVNQGRRTVPLGGGDTVAIYAHWWTPDGTLLDASDLGLNELAAQPQALLRPLRPGRASEIDVPLYIPREASTYRLALYALQHGRQPADEDRSRALTGEVEVIQRDF